MVIDFNALANLRNQYTDKKIVLSSGTFDLFHLNHLNYLKAARKYGDIMVVMVSSDKRVRLSKGDHRPIYPDTDRAGIIDGLRPVDYVFIEPGKKKRGGKFDQIYSDVFANLKPDVFVTANEDWQNYTYIMGGTKLVVLPRVTGGYHPSTSAIIEHISKF
jgi:cytidyltransferase-like protein